MLRKRDRMDSLPTEDCIFKECGLLLRASYSAFRSIDARFFPFSIAFVYMLRYSAILNLFVAKCASYNLQLIESLNIEKQAI